MHQKTHNKSVQNNGPSQSDPPTNSLGSLAMNADLPPEPRTLSFNSVSISRTSKYFSCDIALCMDGHYTQSSKENSAFL